MFNKLFKLFKTPIMPTSIKQQNKVFLLKDIRQYKLEYINTINYMVGKNWPLGNKKISFNNLKSIKIFKFIFHIFFIFFLYSIFLL